LIQALFTSLKVGQKAHSSIGTLYLRRAGWFDW
jgi:hypothetical protein